MAEEENQSGNWSIVVPTQGVKPMTAKGGRTRITKSGLYKLKFTSSSAVVAKEKGTTWVKLSGKIIRTPGDASEYLGAEAALLLPADEADEYYARKWKAVLLNTAKDPANLEKPNAKVKLGPASVLEKECFIYVQAPPAGTKAKDGIHDADPFINACSPAEAAELLKEEAAQGKAPAAGQQTQTNGATPPPAAAAAAGGEVFQDV